MNKKDLQLVLFALFIALFIGSLKEKFMDFSKNNELKNDIQIAQTNTFNKKFEDSQKVSKPAIPQEHSYADDKSVDVPIAPMKEFSGMKVDEILKLRQQAVSESPVFYDRKNYKPNLDVFRIEDGLKWISAYEVSCYGVDKSTDIGRGPSRESTGILNPELMLYIEVANLMSSEENYCSEVDYLRPYEVTYNPESKTIRAYFNYKAYKEKNNGFHNVVLADANARDLGYNYVTADFSHNIRYKFESNLSNRVIQTSGFYHRGYACKVAEGCNNYSPYESGYEFYLTDLPAKINVKLWKKNPMSQSSRADLYYQMIFN